MPPRAESVHPRYTSLCKATHREGMTWLEAEVNLGNMLFLIRTRALLKSSISLPEWCREGGRGHHGQRASSSRKICVWDFPTYTAVHQVLPFSCYYLSIMSIKKNMLILWYIFRVLMITNWDFVVAAQTHYCPMWSSCWGHSSWRSACVMLF